ncbi:DoxX family protein [Flagellimonas baculiformis]|uniref:DoxX family protein n=1 Tax=Flagellimonas baculiformis TaxID=3067310 RepID=UPI00296F7C93|nr:DoxX family protein [Muricauda sp. D6]
MTKRNKIIYWVATVWLALGMASTGIVQLMGMEEEVAVMDHLGYPIYFLTIIGIWKLLGVVAVLIPKFPLLKEWAYAGFVFTMTGAIASHLAVRDAAVDLFGPTLLLALSIISWYFRPPSRKTIIKQNA